MSLTPYGQKQDHSTTIVGAERTSVQAVQVGDVQAAKATQENLTVRRFGTTIFLKDNVYTKTNFYIKQSRPYIPRRTLRTYLYIRFMRWAFLCYCGLCLPMPFLPDFIGWPWAAATGGLGLIWFLIFSQHMHVIYWTIPAVLSQPILPNNAQSRENDFYEFSLERVEGVYLSAKESGIGLIQRSAGSIQFQALNETAACNVRKSCYLSCCMMWTTIVAVTVSAGIFAFRFTSDMMEDAIWHQNSTLPPAILCSSVLAGMEVLVVLTLNAVRYVLYSQCFHINFDIWHNVYLYGSILEYYTFV